MIEIRPIREEEAETFLRLLCDVFSLDFERSNSVFYAEPFFDLRRKWALFEQGEMCSILTTTPLEFGDGRAVGIAGVATREDARRRGLAGALMETVLKESKRRDESRVLLFAQDTRLYERHGFEPIDEVLRGEIISCDRYEAQELLSISQVKERYDLWAKQDSARLRRDDKRWHYWNWSLRCCEPFEDGYLCTETSTCREAVLDKKLDCWPVAKGTEWCGLKSMLEACPVPLRETRTESRVMARGFAKAPQMFLTDQF